MITLIVGLVVGFIVGLEISFCLWYEKPSNTHGHAAGRVHHKRSWEE